MEDLVLVACRTGAGSGHANGCEEKLNRLFSAVSQIVQIVRTDFELPKTGVSHQARQTGDQAVPVRHVARGERCELHQVSNIDDAMLAQARLSGTVDVRVRAEGN